MHAQYFDVFLENRTFLSFNEKVEKWWFNVLEKLLFARFKILV